MTVKSSRNRKDVTLSLGSEKSLNVLYTSVSTLPLWMKIGYLFRSTECVCCSISVVKVEVKDDRVMNVALSKKFPDGDGDVIEIAESPA